MSADLLNKLKRGEITPEQVKDAFSEEYGGRREYVPPTIDDLNGVYISNEQLRLRSLRDNIPFITPEIKDFKLNQGLILIGAKTGNGKSTALANVIAGFLENRPAKDRAIIITNEESTAAVYNRIACVLLKQSYKKFYNGNMAEEENNEVQDTARSLIGRVIVEEGNRQFDATCLEDVKEMMLYAAEGGFRIAAIDYFQTVTWSRANQDWTPVQVSKDLGFFFKGFGRKVDIPVVAFAQLSPMSVAPDFSQRIQNDKTIANHSFCSIELVPDFEAGTTRAIIHKDRHGSCQGKEYNFSFEGGRLVLAY